jgi:hypothetical protein
MRTEPADTAFHHLRTAPLATVDRGDLAIAMRSSRVMRGWIDTIDIVCARRARELAAADGAESAESMLIDNGRRSGREAQATGQRETICSQVPDLEVALAAGAVSTDHIDALARAAKNLTDAERADLFAMGPMLASEAAVAHVESFSRTCSDMAALVHHQHHPDDDSGELDRKRAASKISRWVDRITGMHNTTISLDPLRDAQLWQLLDAEIARQKQLNGNSGTPFSLLQVQALFAALNHAHQRATAAPTDTAPEPSHADRNTGSPDNGQSTTDAAPGSDPDGTTPETGSDARVRNTDGIHDANDASDPGDAPARNTSGIHNTNDADDADGADGAAARDANDPAASASPDQADPQRVNNAAADSPPDVADDADDADDADGSNDAAARDANDPAASASPDQADPRRVNNAAADSPPDADHRPPLPGRDANIAPSGAELCRPAPTPAGYSQPAIPDVYVHIDLITLLHGPHAGTISELSNGVPIPVSTIRRLCCDANIIPIVLNGNGELLDVGREHRTATRAQRRALRALYRTCAHPHCTVPFDNCRIHHIQPWEHGGRTDLRNMIPLCEAHHHQVHEGGWTITMTPNRHTTWHHPTGTTQTASPDRQPNRLPTSAPLRSGAPQPDLTISETYQPMLC